MYIMLPGKTWVLQCTDFFCHFRLWDICVELALLHMCVNVYMCVWPCTQCICLCIVQILTGVTFDEFVMLNGSDHSCKPPHDVVQLLHLLRVASLQHWVKERRSRSKQAKQKYAGALWFLVYVWRGAAIWSLSDFPWATLSESPAESSYKHAALNQQLYVHVNTTATATNAFYYHRHLRHYVVLWLLLGVMMSSGCCLGIYTTDCKGLCLVLKALTKPTSLLLPFTLHTTPLTYSTEHYLSYKLPSICWFCTSGMNITIHTLCQPER